MHKPVSIDPEVAVNPLDIDSAMRMVRDRQDQLRTDMAWQRVVRRARHADGVSRGRRGRPGR